jgi:L-aspartate oxidase
MARYDARLELAPRDVVARAIHDEMAAAGADHVLLDISHRPAAEVLAHFPTIAARCAEEGVDITKDPIPVAPAQHYTCGGVATGLHGEVAGVAGLYAAGEVAMSGVHGANRLASNSLLEGLVFADRAVGPAAAHAEYAARHCGPQLEAAAAAAAAAPAGGSAPPPRPLAGPVAEWAAARRGALQALMWRAAGIVRRRAGLLAAAAEVAALEEEVRAVAASHGPAKGLVELGNLVTVSGLVLGCALQRRESRGGHFCADDPGLDPAAQPSRMSLRAPRGGGPAAPGAEPEAEDAGPAPAGKAGGSSAAGRRSPLKGRAPSPVPLEVAREVAVRSTPQDQE